MHLIQEAYLIWLSEIRVSSNRRTLINDTSISTLLCVRDQRRDIFASLIKLKKSSKIHVDRGFNLNSRTYNEWIKIPTNGCVLMFFHAKSDHPMYKHEEKIMASVWNSDKSEKISKKSLKISYQMWNVVSKNYSILKVFDKEKDSLNLREMRCFYARARDFFPFSNFSPPQKF